MLLLAMGGCLGKQSQQLPGNMVLKSEVQVLHQNEPNLDDQEANSLGQQNEHDVYRTYSASYDLANESHEPVSDKTGMESDDTPNVLNSSNYIKNDPYYTFEIHSSPEPRDEVVVKSVTIRDCVARGLVHNLSKGKFARNVEITLGSRDGNHSVKWTWPLTVMPGEYAPFEIEIDWDPSYLDVIVGGPLRGPGQRLNSRDLAGNILSSVTADFTTEVDVSRAFAMNWDRSGSLIRYEELQQLIIYDERLFDLNEWDEWNYHARLYQLVSEDAFEYSFPKSLIMSDDIDAIASKFTILEQFDLYYIPEVVFPDVFDRNIHFNVDDIVVFQAITEGIDVLDVRQLIPFVPKLEADDPASQFSSFVPHSDFVNASGQGSSSKYVLLVVPEIYPKMDDGLYDASVSHGSESAIWVGQKNPAFSGKQETLTTSDEASRKSCDRVGGLTKEEVRFGSSPNVLDVTLGYYGMFREFMPGQEQNDSVQIDLTTISTQDGFVRGLVHNLSDSLFAREVIIDATWKEIPVVAGKWKWPLTIQPGERAPFEIFLGDWTEGIPTSELDLQISYEFSEKVDITRSLQAHAYNQGTVYSEMSREQLVAAVQSEYIFEDVLTDGAFRWPHQHITREKYDDRYQSGEEDDVKPVFHFVDLYIQLEIPDSHPSLGSLIASQPIDNLRSYVAIVDDDGRVDDVKELVPYTVSKVDGSAHKDISVVEGIPAPNLTSPGSFRLLSTIPYSEEAGRDLRNMYQVWIGGDGESEDGSQ